MKKSIPTLLTIFLTSLVSAGPVEGVQQLLSGLGEIIIILIQFISDTILDINSFDEFLFAKILLFTIILLIVNTVIKDSKMLGGNKAIHWTVSVSVGILSIRFIPDNFVQAILLQYSALGIALTIFLPFIIFFLFAHKGELGPYGRKFGWMFYAAVFASMWIFRSDDLGEANWIYGIGLLLIMIARMFDKKIHSLFTLAGLRAMRNAGAADRYSALGNRIDEIITRIDKEADGPIKKALIKRKDKLEVDQAKIAESL